MSKLAQSIATNALALAQGAAPNDGAATPGAPAEAGAAPAAGDVAADPKGDSGKPVVEPAGAKAGDGKKPEGEEDAAPADDKTATRFAAISRRENAVRKSEAALKQEREAFDAEKKKYEGYADLAKLAKEDPAKALATLGVDFVEAIKLAARMKANGGKRPEPSADEKVRELEKKITEKEEREAKEREEATKREHDAQIAQFVSNIDKHLKAAPDKFELCLIEGDDATEAIFWIVKQHLDETGELIELDDAAGKVESYLEARAQQIRSAKKFGAPPPDETAAAGTKAGTTTAAKAPASGQSPKPVTISNKNAPRTAPRPKDDAEPELDDQGRLKRRAGESEDDFAERVAQFRFSKKKPASTSLRPSS